MSEYHKDTLANGLRVITVPMPHLHCAEMVCYVGVGSRNESPQRAGVSHFLEHMLFRGTAEYPSSLHLERAFEAIGGAVNASTDAENTCFHSRIHPRHLSEGAALFASMLLRPKLDEVEVERRIILEEALEDFNEQGVEINPDNHISRLLWPGHPLSQPTIGTREAIAATGSTELAEHLAGFYTPANTVLAVAGPVRREAVLAAAQDAFGGWMGGEAPSPLPVLPAPAESKAEAVWVPDSDSQVSVQLAFRMPGRLDPRSIPLRVLRRVLSGSGAARLMLRLREELGLTYSVEANLALYADCGCLTVDMAVAPDNLVEAVRETLAVLLGLCNEPAGEEELSGVVRTYLYDLDFSRDHTDALAMRYGWGELAGCLRTLEMDRREISAVTAAEVQAVARELLVPGGLKAAFVGPFRKGDRREVEALLAAFRS